MHRRQGSKEVKKEEKKGKRDSWKEAGEYLRRRDNSEAGNARKEQRNR